MSVARVIEMSATSTHSFEDAIQQGIARATRTLRHVTSAWIKEQRVEVRDGRIAGYQVNMLVTFVLEDTLGAPDELAEEALPE
jgi:flavin-binding protein dodecin